ncbi:hypothetical protein K488DRAFT_90417 [Vararia minispora EC-137]|uniref:Uncharacterized protein n=1 Tax=Vararia minispora EC-137 TaxID=1314806 RepID=A0ACB8Q887_9AGAM|nr:hypothetical protein K488DRAFT_90417 [Vararia minispora EC-137]
MSQLMISEDDRVCDLLPASVENFALLTKKALKNSKDWTCLHPFHIQDALQVLVRQRIGRSLLPYLVVYGPGVHPGATDQKMISVGLELYGFLAAASLGEFRNWNRKKKDIHQATWNLRIEGGPLDNVFCPQADTLWEIEQYVIGTIKGQGLPLGAIEKGHTRLRAGIFVNRHVFCKVKDGKPEKNLAKNFCRGNFVKVSVQFGIERKLYPKPGDVIVCLQLNQVIQLVPARETGEGKVIPSLDIEGDDAEDMEAEDEVQVQVQDLAFQQIY